MLWILVFLVALGAAAQVQPLGIVPEPAPVQLTISTDKPTYSPGEPLTITLTINRCAYVYILEKDPYGKLRLVFPNAHDPVPYLCAGTHVLPRGYYVFYVQPPFGPYELYAVAFLAPCPSCHPQDLLRWAGTIAVTSYRVVYPVIPPLSPPPSGRITSADIVLFVVLGVLVTAVIVLAWERSRRHRKTDPIDQNMQKPMG